MIIPKIIHQTWKTRDIPSVWHKSHVEWQRLHPTWTYRLWTDEDLRNLVVDHYPEMLKVYDDFPYPIQRVDMARYMILDRHGGVYSDLDLIPVTPIDPFLVGSMDVYLVHSGNVKTCLTNALMASVPGAPLWKRILRTICSLEDFHRRRSILTHLSKHMYIMETTGPMMVDHVVRTHSEMETIGMLPQSRLSMVTPPKVKSTTAIVTTRGSSWCSWDTYVLSFIFRIQIPLALFGSVAAVILVVALIVVVVQLAMRLKKCRLGGG